MVHQEINSVINLKKKYGKIIKYIIKKGLYDDCV